MNGNDDKGILRQSMVTIDVGFQEQQGNPSLDLKDEAIGENQAAERADEFRTWLEGALGELQGNVCFVDYTVFQDPKVKNPYFYLVSPTIETKERYVAAVKELVEGTDGKDDCFSVAFHPNFVGIGNDDNYSASQSNSFAVISAGYRTDRRGATLDPPSTIKSVDNWDADYYPLWPKNESRWPPTSKSELRRICGRRTLDECFAKFQSILADARHELCDSSGRPLTFLFCVPFLVSNSSSQLSTSNLPFSEIAAALFLGVSYEGNAEEARDAVTPFLRTLALRTYRAGMKKAGQAGKVEGLEEAIETFAHQIKGVATAMSTQWAVDLATWERIKQNLGKEATHISQLERALVLPAPLLIEAVRDTLVLWSQTRRVGDLYGTSSTSNSGTAWPSRFSDIVNRAWELTTRARFALENVNRNLGELIGDILKVWGQGVMIAEKPRVVGDVATSLRDLSVFDRDAEAWICNITRLLAAIFDNALEHGESHPLPIVTVNLCADQKTMSFEVSNTVRKEIEEVPSRLRLGMKGNEVLQSLARRLQASLKLPDPVPGIGETYRVEVTLQLPRAFTP
jgi:hypothetical protein